MSNHIITKKELEPVLKELASLIKKSKDIEIQIKSLNNEEIAKALKNGSITVVFNSEEKDESFKYHIGTQSSKTEKSWDYSTPKVIKLYSLSTENNPFKSMTFYEKDNVLSLAAVNCQARNNSKDLENKIDFNENGSLKNVLFYPEVPDKDCKKCITSLEWNFNKEYFCCDKNQLETYPLIEKLKVSELDNSNPKKECNREYCIDIIHASDETYSELHESSVFPSGYIHTIVTPKYEINHYNSLFNNLYKKFIPEINQSKNSNEIASNEEKVINSDFHADNPISNGSAFNSLLNNIKNHIKCKNKDSKDI